jgi:hypothetical protein
MVKKSSKIKTSSKKSGGKLSNGDKLVCDECGLTLVVKDACSCDPGDTVVCCGEHMKTC